MTLEDWNNSQPVCILITDGHILEAASKVAGLQAVRRLLLLPSTVRHAEPRRRGRLPARGTLMARPEGKR